MTVRVQRSQGEGLTVEQQMAEAPKRLEDSFPLRLAFPKLTTFWSRI
jgi:hypothetical protein